MFQSAPHSSNRANTLSTHDERLEKLFQSAPHSSNRANRIATCVHCRALRFQSAPHSSNRANQLCGAFDGECIEVSIRAPFIEQGERAGAIKLPMNKEVSIRAPFIEQGELITLYLCSVSVSEVSIRAPFIEQGELAHIEGVARNTEVSIRAPFIEQGELLEADLVIDLRGFNPRPIHRTGRTSVLALAHPATGCFNPRPIHRTGRTGWAGVDAHQALFQSAPHSSNRANSVGQALFAR